MAGASGSWEYEEPGFSIFEPATWPLIPQPIMEAIYGITPDVEGAFQNLVNAGPSFLAALHDFDALAGEGVLMSDQAQEYVALRVRAHLARDRLDAIASAAQSVWGTAKSVFGLSGAVRIARSGAAGLGVAPAIPWLSYGVIAGAVVLVTQLTREISRFTINWRLVGQGKPPMADDGGPVGDIASAAKWGALAALAFVLLPVVRDAFKKG